MRSVVMLMLAACGSSSMSKPDPAWMAPLDDTRPLSALSIPGTHDSGARYELPHTGTAQCQDLSIDEQLTAGVRFLDIRCRDVNDAFAIFHGPTDQEMTFDDVLATVGGFLAAYPTETVIMSVKEEYTPVNMTRSFEATFDTYVAKAPDLWYTGDTVPMLGDVRGKIVLLRRFDTTAPPLGIDGSTWLGNNTTFSIQTPAATLRIQDHYTVDSTDTKWTEITALIDEARTGPPDTLYLNLSSGYVTVNTLPNIPDVSNVINPMLDAYLADPANTGDRLGVIASDFVTASRAKLIYSSNR